MSKDEHTIAGTVGGSLCSIWANFAIGDFFHTILMAVIGAVVSYLVSDYLGRNKKEE